MKITFLGTGAGVPSKLRNVSSLTLHLANKTDDIWLFDCGEATQHQILSTTIKLRKINKIFISHLHGDHIFGLPGLIGSRSFQGAEQPLTIYGPAGIKQFIETSLKVSGTYLKYELTIHEITSNNLLFEDKEFIVTNEKLDHGLTSYGFRIVQKDLPGSLLMDKVMEYNIPIGPVLQQLKLGLDVTLEDGRTFSGKDFVGPPKKGKIVAILGDTRFTDAAIRLAENADLLVHESTFAKDEEHLAKDYFHSTTVQAALVAKEANAKKLILNHISSRYQQDDDLLEEAKAIFPNTEIAKDLATFEVP